MPLPTPRLDDRRFHDLVEEAKSRIPHYCPDWTDHNVSDPGVALIELFAWMTDLLLYRVNQVPDKLYIKFLELIGVSLEAPRAARAPVTFYLSAAQPTDVAIPEGTEVATVRTETSPAIVFSTESELAIRTPTVLGAYTRPVPPADDDDLTGPWTAFDRAKLRSGREKITVFPDLTPGDALYIPLERDHSQHVLAVVMTCEIAGGAGVKLDDPPLAWEVWQGESARWVACDMEFDGTGGFNTPGEVILHVPAMAPGEFANQQAFWLRCRLTQPREGQRTYYAPPIVERLAIEARGATIGARHATSIRHEILGQSDGTPGQMFALQHTPLLEPDPRHDYLVVDAPGSEPEIWHEVEDFAESGPEDRHYTLDCVDGTLTLGPTLLQPDGTVYRFGATPPKRSWLRFSRYQHGGGVAGNVPSGTLNVLKTSIPYVTQVTNREGAFGGRDAQSLDDARLRAPHMLRTRTRAVTAEDYEYLALQVAGVARAHSLTPGTFPPLTTDVPPGEVVVLVVPQRPESESQMSAADLALSRDLRAAVKSHLDGRRVLGVNLDVRAPTYVEVTVAVTLRVADSNDARLVDEVMRQAREALYQYLSPYTGGPEGQGWPIGRDLHVSEIYARLQRIPSVEYVEDVRVTTGNPDLPGTPLVVSPRLSMASDALLCSGEHVVDIV